MHDCSMRLLDGSETITIESRTDDAPTPIFNSRVLLIQINSYEYEFLWIRKTCELNIHYSVLFSSRVSVMIRVSITFRVWLVSCYAHVQGGPKSKPLSIIIIKSY